MPQTVKDQLFRLVQSMTKAERRNFKLFATRAGGTADSKFVRLFDILSRLEKPNDAVVLKRLACTPGQLSNLKRHLYQQVLTSLRMIYIDKEIDIELREQIDFTRILYGKGHYLDALRTLERAKAKAVEHSQDLLHLEILEFQKLIEARHVTLSRQVDNKLDLLLNESARRCYSVLDTSELFSLNIQIHGRYIEHGHSLTPEQRSATQQFWRHIQTRRADLITSMSTFNQNVNRAQAVMWYNYIQLDFPAAYAAAAEAHSSFTVSRQMIVMDTDLYLRCLYYVAMLAYLTGDEPRLTRHVETLGDLLTGKKVRFNENTRRIGQVYYYLSLYNLHFLRRDDPAALALGSQLAVLRSDGDFQPSPHRRGLFHYKHAAACFRNGEDDAALDHLNAIVNMRASIFREDLLISTRLLHAICNYELGNFSLVDYHLTGLNRLLRRSRETAECHRLATATLRKLMSTPVAERKPVYTQLRQRVEELRPAPFEHKALLYLDLRDWLDRHVSPESDT